MDFNYKITYFPSAYTAMAVKAPMHAHVSLNQEITCKSIQIENNKHTTFAAWYRMLTRL